MNWKTIFAAGLLLASAQISGVLAGVEPSPFQPEINQLGAVANILNSADFRVLKTVSFPPDPCTPPDPCKGLNGDVNRLKAIESQVSSTDDMVFSIINEVMGVEPSPFRVDLVPPLQVVRDAAQGIVNKIGEFSGGSSAPEFLEALGNVAASADLLVKTVDKSVIRLSEPMACEYYDNRAACGEAGCMWNDTNAECAVLPN